MDKTQKLLKNLDEEIQYFRYISEDILNSHSHALNAYDDIGHDYEPQREDPTLGFELMLHSAADSTAYFTTDLKAFDKQLAKIIELRGKLAEEVGIPMMSHMGKKKFGRYSEEYTL